MSERIKDVPAQALRGVFAGIGQLLLMTDRLRNKAPADAAAPRAWAPEPPAGEAAAGEAAAGEAAPGSPEPVTARPARTRPVTAEPTAPRPTAARRAPAEPAAGKPAAAERPKPPKPQRTRDLDKTGNVRLLRQDEAPLADAGVPQGTATATAGRPGEAGSPRPGEAGPPRPGEAGPPLPGYDQLSVASLRARLRSLDVAQVRRLAAYERAHAGRPDVTAMFERRIAKLQGEADARAAAEARADVTAEARTEVEAEAEGEA